MVCPARARRDSSNLARQFTDLTNLRRCGRSQQFLRLSQPHTEVGRGSSGNANSPAGRNVIRALKGLWFLAGAALLLGSEVWPSATPPAPLVGFSYSPLMLYGAQRDPAQDLQSLLDAASFRAFGAGTNFICAPGSQYPFIAREKNRTGGQNHDRQPAEQES